MKKIMALTLALAFFSFNTQDKKQHDATKQSKSRITNQTKMKKKVLIIVSNANIIGPNNRKTGIFLPEVAHPYAEFTKAVYQIDYASLTGATPYLDALNLASDPDNLEFLTGKGWEDMQKAIKLADVNVSEYDAIFVP